MAGRTDRGRHADRHALRGRDARRRRASDAPGGNHPARPCGSRRIGRQYPRRARAPPGQGPGAQTRSDDTISRLTMGDQLRPDWSGRLTRAWQQAAAANRAALIVSTPTNLLYLCGFAGSQGVLVLSANARWLMLDGRYDQATREAIAAGDVGPVEVRTVPSRFDQALADVCASLPAGEIAFEGDHVT